MHTVRLVTLVIAVFAMACERQLPIVGGDSDFESEAAGSGAASESNTRSNAAPNLSSAQPMDPDCELSNLAVQSDGNVVDGTIYPGMRMIDVEGDQLVFGMKDGVFKRAKQPGGMPSLVSAIVAAEVAVQSGTIYFVPSYGMAPEYQHVQAVPLSGGVAAPLVVQGWPVEAESIVRDEAAVYMTGDRNGCPAGQKLAIVNAAGSSRLVDIGCAIDLTAFGGTAYIVHRAERARGYTISKLAPNATELEPLVPGGNEIRDHYASGMSFTASESYVYFVLGDAEDISREYLGAVPTTGGPIRVLAGPARGIDAIKAVGDAVYMTTLTPGCLYRYSERTGKVQTLAGRSNPVVTAADDAYLYLASGIILRLAR